MYHLVVTRPMPKHKVGSLITDATEIAAMLAGPDARSTVRVFDHLTHGAAAATTAAPSPEAASEISAAS